MYLNRKSLVVNKCRFEVGRISFMRASEIRIVQLDLYGSPCTWTTISSGHEGKKLRCASWGLCMKAYILKKTYSENIDIDRKWWKSYYYHNKTALWHKNSNILHIFIYCINQGSYTWMICSLCRNLWAFWYPKNASKTYTTYLGFWFQKDIDWIFQMRYCKLKRPKGFESCRTPNLVDPMMHTQNYNICNLPVM